MPHITETDGGRALRRLVTSSVKSCADIGRALGVGRQLVAKWVGGRQRPEPHFRDAIEGVLGIPRADWYTDEERRIAALGALERPHFTRDEDVPEYDPAVDEPAPEEVAS